MRKLGQHQLIRRSMIRSSYGKGSRGVFELLQVSLTLSLWVWSDPEDVDTVEISLNCIMMISLDLNHDKYRTFFHWFHSYKNSSCQIAKSVIYVYYINHPLTPWLSKWAFTHSPAILLTYSLRYNTSKNHAYVHGMFWYQHILPSSFRLTSLALDWSCDCPNSKSNHPEECE